MTNNQINYQRNLETARHNLVAESQGWAQIQEVNRHNLVAEAQGWSSITETARHNRESEALGWGNLRLGYNQLNEQIRHNKAGEALGWANYGESVRHNKATESINWYNAKTSRYKAEADVALGWANYDVNYNNMLTRQREAETSWYSAQGRFTTDLMNANSRQRELDLREQEQTWTNMREWRKIEDKWKMDTHNAAMNQLYYEMDYGKYGSGLFYGLLSNTSQAYKSFTGGK